MHVEVSIEESPLVSIPSQPKEMVSVTQRDGKTFVRINSSSLSTIQECGRKTKLSLIDRWRPREEGAPTLFGRGIHRAMEIFYSGDIAERKLPKLETLEMIGFGHAADDSLIARAVSGFVEVVQPLSALPASDKRSIQNGIWILREYFKQYIDDPYVAYVDKDGPFIERTFTHRILETDVLVVDIFGTIDFAFRNTQTGEVTPGDHKTTSSLGWGGSSYYDRDKPNHQYTMYMLGAKREFGINTEDFIVNVIEVKAKPVRATSKGVSFPRQITKRTEEDFQETIESILFAVGDLLYMRKENTWPMGGVDACNKYGGCEYKQICAAPKSMRETILSNKFKQQEK